VLRCLAPTVAEHVVTLTWTSVTNVSYSVQRGSDVRFQAGASIVGSNIVGQAGLTQFTDTNAPAPAFYRAPPQAVTVKLEMPFIRESPAVLRRGRVYAKLLFHEMTQTNH